MTFQDSGKNLPAHFYKYCSLDLSVRPLENPGSYSISSKEKTWLILNKNQVWFAKPKEFNDPFECEPALSPLVYNTKSRKALSKIMLMKNNPLPRNSRRRAAAKMSENDKFMPTLYEGRSRSAEQMGILCLSSRRDHMLMWSHYAASHTGICLRFNSSFRPFNDAKEVEYAEHRPVVDAVIEVAEGGPNLVRKGILTKADCWSYEQEWRVITFPQSHISFGPGPVTFQPQALDGIILGARISAKDSAEVREWAAGRKHHIEVLQAQKNPNHFHLDFVPPGTP